MADERERRGVGAGPLLVAWLLAAAAFVGKTQLTVATTPLILDTDDAMRLTEVHDFLAGQRWFDLVQHRLNTPLGGEIHWSRLIDAPEAGLLWLVHQIPGIVPDTALAYGWPLLLLLPLLWLSARIAIHLGGPAARWPGLLLPALSLVSLAEFAPGRLDHHSAQILLSLVMQGAALAAFERPRLAVVAGVAAGLALSIGIEGLPMVATTALVLGLGWVIAERHSLALRNFGLSFALTTALGLAQGVPPSRWLTPMFDAISIVYAAAALLCGLALLLLSLTRFRDPLVRLLAAVAAALLIGGMLLATWPALLKGPYGALDPWLIANWIDRISEAEPWSASLIRDPVYPLAVMLPSLVALVWAARGVVEERPNWGRWLAYGTFLLIAVGVMLLQIRGARIAVPLAVPGCAAMCGAAWRRFSAGRGVVVSLGLLGGWIVSASTVVGIIATAIVFAFPNYADATDDPYRAARQACLMPAAFADLAGLPPERIMAPIDLGSHLLLWTPHSVVAAPYHRNQEAVLDAFRFFNAPVDVARKILERRGISLVVVCPAMKEIRGLVPHTDDSLVSLFAAGRLPPWLVDQSLPGAPLKVYAVAPGR